MRNYSQESGQGGRDRQRNKAIVIIAAEKQAALQKKQAWARAQRQLWKIQSRIISAQKEKQVKWDKTKRFLTDEKCWQIFLDAKIDKRGLRLGYNKRGLRVRCKKGEERCDVYKKDNINAERREA
jgi:superfamily II DNA helicase RecQ